MNVFITGERGEGKTTFIAQLTAQLKSHQYSVMGFYSIGEGSGDYRLQYSLRDVSTDNMNLLCDMNQIEGRIRFGHYYFDPDIIEKGIAILRNSLDTKPNFLFIDEIGKMEIEGGGWTPVLNDVFNLENTIKILGVRTANLKPILQKWNIMEYSNYKISTCDVEEVLNEIARFI